MVRSAGRTGPLRISHTGAGYTPGNLLALICIATFLSTVHPVARAVDRRADQLEPPECGNFSRGDGADKFYSPGSPHLYPSKIDCIRTISVPEGYHIEIDFLDYFEIEESPKCENDFLLIRDGEAPYSRQLARLCGNQFPEKIRSSGNHLWLHFHTDDTIEYRGFKAVYEQLKDTSYKQTPKCKFEVSGPEAIISTGNITDHFSEFIDWAMKREMALECAWRVSVPEDRTIQISFKMFDLDKPNECDLNFVEILHGPELKVDSVQKFCSSKADLVSLPKGHDMTFRYFAAPSTLEGLRTGTASVVAVVTELRDKNEECLEDEFDCDDLYCISAELVCNGNFNCNKQLDEKNCDVDEDEDTRALLTSANVTIMVIGAALLFGLCFSVCWNCVRKLREDFREKEEIVRQSRDADLDLLPGAVPRVRSRVTLDDGGCYVPGTELKLMPEQRNGGGRLVREDLIDLDVDTADCGCQAGGGAAARRRDSRDSCGSGSSTPPPPPPPCRPPSSVYRGRRQDAPPPRAAAAAAAAHPGYNTRPRHAPPPESDDEEDEHRSGLATPRSYRSEAVIEMVPRPGSRHSARSAPDIVVKL